MPLRGATLKRASTSLFLIPATLAPLVSPLTHTSLLTMIACIVNHPVGFLVIMLPVVVITIYSLAPARQDVLPMLQMSGHYFARRLF
ncbi:hypothetical protein K466DRAFT_286554 [Polyporus arcularius HHB13444]|uniref:Uncharacterized protein n=1 Tax=Polyporus arcularius HHB13444 TaxID=1314778 RepID=A0A5C3P3A5_9APHY|nr:hypothetical protein K466DRAFT_286554 [Polyporus arcularius HHB13444]